MDNFTIWVDAPSEALIETPLDDESSCYLRDEILQTQQYVIEKLDEQKANEHEKGECSVEESAHSQKLASMIAIEGKRTMAVSRELVDFRESVKQNELQLMSIKNGFPDSIKADGGRHEKLLFESNNELAILHDNFANREKAIKKLQQGNLKNYKDEAAKECSNLRKSITEAKQKHEKWAALHVLCRKLEADYEQEFKRQKMERESLETAKEAHQAEEVILSQMMEECASLRSQIVQLESARSKNQNEVDEKQIEDLRESSKKVRQETSELTSALENVKQKTEVVQKQLNVSKKEEAKCEKQIGDRKKAILDLLQRKINDTKKKLGKGAEQKKISELKKAITKETAVFENAKKELDNANPNKKSISELKREISSTNTEIRTYEKKIREATKENGKLIEEIGQMRGPSTDSTPPLYNFNDTAEFVESDYSQHVPQPSLEITPIQRRFSRDVFTGVPFMTSTPLQKAPDASVKTRAAARRLEQTAAVKTAEIRKKRGKK